MNDNVKATEDIKMKRIREEAIVNEPLYTYIGETSRSAFERGEEHEKDGTREKSQVL